MKARTQRTQTIFWTSILASILACSPSGKGHKSSVNSWVPKGGVQFFASDSSLASAFNWAKAMALSFAHDGYDPVGYWYEAALPNREAFCMRDVSHQVIGAEILGLSRHNLNMMLKFAQNISEEKDYCSYWEINRYNKPAPVDYETDKDFWYNLPANFDVIYGAHRLYNWTGDHTYLKNADFKDFYELSLNEYIDRWQLGRTEVLKRDRKMHIRTEASSRFGMKRGIPTYNEGGRGETRLGIDMTASLVAAYQAYSEILTTSGQEKEALVYEKKTALELDFLNEFWWDNEKQTYRSILYEDGTFDHFMVGNDQAFLHYLYYFDVIDDPSRILSLVKDYRLHFNELIVELKSYLPIMFYENGHSEVANQMVIDLCDSSNLRRDYPENSFTIIEHITRGLMGINVEAASNTFSTLSRLSENLDWAEMKYVPLLSNDVSVKHFGRSKSRVRNDRGGRIKCEVRITGQHRHLFVNGKEQNARFSQENEQPFSSVLVELDGGEEVFVSATL